MEIGMLWYDNGSNKLKERVQRAAEYYTDKYGRKPNLCLVNPEMIKGETSKVNGVQVRTAAAVMPNHFWIGVDEAAGKNGAGNGKSKSKAGSKAAKPGSKRGKKKKAD